MSGAELFLPVFHSFETGNIFTGSRGNLRYRAAPNIVMRTPKEVDLEQSSITAQVWHRPLCYELSEIEDEQTFPMSHEGREALYRWLIGHTSPGD